MEIFWPKVESRKANLTKIELVNIKVGRGSGIAGRFASLLVHIIFLGHIHFLGSQMEKKERKRNKLRNDINNKTEKVVYLLLGVIIALRKSSLLIVDCA